MVNLKTETEEKLDLIDATPADVEVVRSLDGVFACGWEHFAKRADVEYDNGYGSAEVATDLIIVLVDGRYLYRHEYDGAESWVLGGALPVLVAEPVKPSNFVSSDGWETLKEIEG